MPDDAAINTEVGKALLQEYGSTRDEIILHVQLYKTQFRNLGVVTAISGVLVPLIIAQRIPGTGIAVPVTGWIALLVMYIISTAALAIAASLIANLFAMQVLGVRCERVEDQINKYLGEKFLIWEHFVNEIWGPKGPILKSPDTSFMVMVYLLLLLFAGFFPLMLVTQIMCSSPGNLLLSAAFAYAWYTTALLLHVFYTNWYTMAGGVRADIRRMFETRAGEEIKPLTLRGWEVIIGIVLVGGLCASGILAATMQSRICTNVGQPFSNSGVPDGLKLKR